MKSLSRFMLVLSVASLVLPGAPGAFAQQDGGQSGRRWNRDRGFDPSRIRTQMMDRMKEQLGAADEEWVVIEPLLADVMAKQRSARGGGAMLRGFMRPPRGPQEGRPPADFDGPPPEGMPPQGGPGGPMISDGAESDALQAVLDKTESKTEEIQTKLTELRVARKKAEAELQTAREALRKVLTLRQEAQLVLMGYLD